MTRTAILTQPISPTCNRKGCAARPVYVIIVATEGHVPDAPLFVCREHAVEYTDDAKAGADEILFERSAE